MTGVRRPKRPAPKQLKGKIDMNKKREESVMRRISITVIIAGTLSAMWFTYARYLQDKPLVASTAKAAESENGPGGDGATPGSRPQRGGGAFKSTIGILPQNVRTQFLESLMFKNGSLATAYIGGIKSGLTPSQYQQVLQSLGIAPTASQDYTDYACDGVATCYKKKDSICISANCTVGPKARALGAMLVQIPSADRNRFLESLDFVGGRLVSAHVGSVRPRLKQTELEQLFAGFGVSPAELQRTTGDYYSR